MDSCTHMNEESENWNSNVCLKILKKMNRFGKNIRFWGIIHSQGHVFEARVGDLVRIPYVHENVAINFIHQTPDVYINAYFSKENFMQCYSTNIEPVNSRNLWAQIEYIKPLPPMSRRMSGRVRMRENNMFHPHQRRQEGQKTSHPPCICSKSATK
uniref:Uncharacterized protein n=1 Tax=Lactuca sativa TaxID=4236 RepID=A0A9R1XRF2_LACSA|nr:hypothetical protein LSAT_V11C300138310 [Lactuca sativa]